MGLDNEIRDVFERALTNLNDLEVVLKKLRRNWKPNDSYKKSYVDLPMDFVNKYQRLICKLIDNKNFTSQGIGWVEDGLGNLTRNFDNPFFETQERDYINSLIRDLMDCRRSLDDISARLN